MLVRLIATCGFLGHARVAPGTVASFAATVAAWFIANHFGADMLQTATIFACAFGILISEIYVRKHSQNLDPGEVVIDELAGQWLCFVTVAFLSVLATNTADVVPHLIATTQYSIYFWAAGFVLFRVFDIIKPWPVGWADSRVKGGLGIMLDDLIAGVLAGVVLFVAMNLFPAIFIQGAELP